VYSAFGHASANGRITNWIILIQRPLERMDMTSVLFRDATIFDGESAQLRESAHARVVDGLIQEISDTPLSVPPDTDIVECKGRTLMPGLIDAHVHVYAASVNLARTSAAPHSYLAHFAALFLRSALDRGFTTVRDVAGADVGLARAIREGLVGGSRVYYGGRLLSQTGGHGDWRPGDEALHYADPCGCSCHHDALAVIADGADAIRKAIREELRRGASHIKIMGSGGVASPTDPIDKCQYSDEEVIAAVDETTRAGKYVAAHCHPSEAVRRSVTLGVRSIEHATMIDEDTAKFVAQSDDAFVVPTMAIIFGLLEEGEKLGFPAVSMDKLRQVSEFALSGLEIMQRAGVRMGLGTDLLGSLHTRQSEEFSLRARVQKPIDILRSACSVNAELLNEPGKLGCVREGAIADLLLIGGDPLKDINLLAQGGRHLSVIMKDGQFHKRS
jgi:imidazolonepropionase-like amidohydrolase